MARLGLGGEWRCEFANEISEKKAASYRANFGPSPELAVCDVASLSAEDLPGTPDLVWASFPCQDLSLAGGGAGLEGKRSGTFTPFWNLMERLISGGRIPKLIVLENVIGTLTSHGGNDFQSIVRRLADQKHRVGCLTMDAAVFIPQSRPRLFFIGVHSDLDVDSDLVAPSPGQFWCTRSLWNAHRMIPHELRSRWVWWNLPVPECVAPPFSSLLEDDSVCERWHTQAETEHLISLMAPVHLKKLDEALRMRRRVVGSLYRRTRPNGAGINVQRAEIRFDEVSGCLRTPGGGSSRQTVLIVSEGRVRSRLLSSREAARLMGVPDSYPLPENYNDAYHLFGDGVAVPVVSWLSQNLLLPIVASRRIDKAA